MRPAQIAFIILLVIAIPSVARGQVKVTEQAAPAKMKATADLTLRNAPPSGILNASGDKIGTVNKDDTVIVTAHKTTTNLFGKYNWAQVDVLDPSTGKPKASGWVYAGGSSDTYLKKLN